MFAHCELTREEQSNESSALDKRGENAKELQVRLHCARCWCWILLRASEVLALKECGQDPSSFDVARPLRVFMQVKRIAIIKQCVHALIKLGHGLAPEDQDHLRRAWTNKRNDFRTVSASC